jgi:hypothetical protein
LAGFMSTIRMIAAKPQKQKACRPLHDVLIDRAPR